MLNITEMGLRTTWTPNHLKFINLIKENPVIYTLDKNNKDKQQQQILKERNAWGNIERIMGSQRKCLLFCIFADFTYFGLSMQ